MGPWQNSGNEHFLCGLLLRKQDRFFCFVSGMHGSFDRAKDLRMEQVCMRLVSYEAQKLLLASHTDMSGNRICVGQVQKVSGCSFLETVVPLYTWGHVRCRHEILNAVAGLVVI